MFERLKTVLALDRSAIKTGWSGGIAPRKLNLCTKWR